MTVLRNLGATEEHERLAASAVEDISDALSRQGIAIVAGAHPVFRMTDALSPNSIARELGVGYVIQGSVRGAANRAAVNLQLINGESGVHLWSERLAVDLGAPWNYATKPPIGRPGPCF